MKRSCCAGCETAGAPWEKPLRRQDYRAALEAAVAELMGWLEEDDELERNDAGKVNVVQAPSPGKGDGRKPTRLPVVAPKP